jgi:ferritin-like metal-binding protein YciE
MQIETLRDLLVHKLKDPYSDEKQFVKALTKVAKAATNPALPALAGEQR